MLPRHGSKHHVIACGCGSPLAFSLTGGNRNDITEMIPLVDAIPQVRGPADVRVVARASSTAIAYPLPRRPQRARLRARDEAVDRERTIAWLHQYRPLRVRYERRADIHEAFLVIGCSLICLKIPQGAGRRYAPCSFRPLPPSRAKMIS